MKIVLHFFSLLLVVVLILSLVTLVSADHKKPIVEIISTNDDSITEVKTIIIENRTHEPDVKLQNKKPEKVKEKKEDEKDFFREVVPETQPKIEDHQKEDKPKFAQILAEEFDVESEDAHEKFQERHEIFMENVQARIEEYFSPTEVSEDVKAEYVSKFNERKQEFTDSNAHFQHVKEKTEQATQNYNNHKEKIQKLREEVRACQGDLCQAKKIALKESAKEHMIKTLDVMDTPLDKYSNRIESANHLSDTHKQIGYATAAQIQREIDTVRAEVEVLDKETSPHEFKMAVEREKQMWVDSRQQFKSMVGALSLSKIAVIIETQQKEYDSIRQEIEGSPEEVYAVQKKYMVQIDTLRKTQLTADASWEAGDFGTYQKTNKQLQHTLQESRNILNQLREVIIQKENNKKTLKSQFSSLFTFISKN
jgi:hypothetical protein